LNAGNENEGQTPFNPGEPFDARVILGKQGQEEISVIVLILHAAFVWNDAALLKNQREAGHASRCVKGRLNASEYGQGNELFRCRHRNSA
jgi:hypothetical protein